MKKKLLILTMMTLMLISFCLAGTIISNDVVETKFLDDYQTISDEKNSLELTTADYSDIATNKVLITQIDSSMGINIINFDVSGKAVTKISAKPEIAPVVEEIVKCWHCESGILEAYPTTKTDCLASNDILFFDEAEKLCQAEPQTTCYICNVDLWIIEKKWLTSTECLSKTNQYIIYDEAYKACQEPDKPILVDCYFCDGGYKLITSQECTDNGGHLTKEECITKTPCYICLDEGTKNIEAIDEKQCTLSAGFTDERIANDFCNKKPLQCFTCTEPIEVKTSQECLDNKGLFNKELLTC